MSNNWEETTDAKLKEAVKAIIRSSDSEEEIRDRVARELGYPYTLALSVRMPTDNIGRQARAIGSALGGLTTKNGAMAMCMLYGPSRETLTL